MLKKMKTTDMYQGDDAQRTLMLNKVSENISQDDLERYFETKFNCKVEKISMSIDKPMVMFSNDIFQSGIIKSCFKIGMRNR